MRMWVPALCLHPFGGALEANTHSFHCIASSKKTTVPGEEPQKSTTGLLPQPLQREGREHRHQCLVGRGVQAAHNPVTGRCECGDCCKRMGMGLPKFVVK